MSDYRKTNIEELDSLMTEIYECQRGCHNYEYWEDNEYSRIDKAMYIVEKLINEKIINEKILHKI